MRIGKELEQGKDIRSETKNSAVNLLLFDMWSREPISVRSLPLGSHFNKLLVFDNMLAI